MAASDESAQGLIRAMRRDFREIVSLFDPHMDEDDCDIKQDWDCYCARCIAVRALMRKTTRRKR